MQHIMIEDTMNGTAPAAVFMIIFLSIILYLVLTISVEKTRYDDLRDVSRMIETGHRKAMNGKRGDGMYREKKHLKDFQEDLERCEKEAQAQARRNLALLS